MASAIDLELYEGELTAIIGINGVGKSTLLRSLSGVQEMLAGEVYINQNKLKDISPGELAQSISVVLTEQPVSRNLTVFELIALGRQPYTNWIGTLTQEDRQQINYALQLVGIEDLQHKKCYELSDGQLQKVLIGRALAQDTPLVVLDEPTTHLDIYHQAYVLKLLKNLTVKTKKSILFSTHEINLALQLCDKIILMEKGRVTIGTPTELVEKNMFAEMFPDDLIIFDRETRSFRINIENGES
ncbi:ABC transporter ATP-binding protein [Antarcticibacterium sp. W02-3]|uniref:ABC transporter ATP-binding protein n=1 Tax=Antarcticibacterium sp. W02-3 TaxID=2183747 RepID=UPI0033405550